MSLSFSAIHILVQTSFLMSCNLKIYPWLEEVRYNQTYLIDLMILILFKQVRQTWLFYQTSIVTFLSIFPRFLICICCWANSQTFDQIDVFVIVYLHISCCIWVLKTSAFSIGSIHSEGRRKSTSKNSNNFWKRAYVLLPFGCSKEESISRFPFKSA